MELGDNLRIERCRLRRKCEHGGESEGDLFHGYFRKYKFLDYFCLAFKTI